MSKQMECIHEITYRNLIFIIIHRSASASATHIAAKVVKDWNKMQRTK